MKSDRTYITLQPELNARVTAYAHKLSMTKVQFLIMCVQAGMGAVVRAVYPEEAISSQKMAEIIVEMIKTGKPVVLPDGTVIGSEENALDAEIHSQG